MTDEKEHITVTGDTGIVERIEQVECCGAHPVDAEAVPIGELENLVEQWRDTLEWAEEHQEICSNEAIRVGERKADELEAVIAEYQHE